MRPWLLMLLLPLLVHVSPAARILGINPTPSISHQLPFLIIMRALAERGHQVTIITANPMQDAPPNTTQIDVSFTYEKWKKEINFFHLSTLNPADSANYMIGVAASDCKAQFESPDLKKFIESPGEFDLVVMEIFLHWCYFGLIHKLGSPPVVGFWSAEPFPHQHRMMGNPINPAYFPDVGTSYNDHMTFWERANNIYKTYESLRIGQKLIEPHDQVIKEYFGSGVPSSSELQYNISLLLVTNHFCMGYPKPLQPTVIQMTGLHIAERRTPLPQDIKKFLDGATHGVIYFSLGSNVQSKTLPEHTRKALMEAFAQLPQRVLWKFEDDSLPGKPNNVMIAKWLPQQDVLAHQNVKLFITQGGLQSFNEAAYFGVPLIGIPFFGDQGYNVAKMINAGIGVKLDFRQITKEGLLQAVKTVLETPSYKKNMEHFSEVYREHQRESLGSAVWWIEYVDRHRGARHLRSAALDLQWWQLLLLDVIGCVLILTAILTYILYKAFRWLVSCAKVPGKVKKQ